MIAKIHSLILLAGFFLISLESRSQSYGLAFHSHEVVQDLRTGLDLSPGSQLCFGQDFEISFDLNFMPKRDDYFGYILRIGVSDKQNIDLIYDKDIREKFHFKIIIGDKFTKIAFNIPPDQLFNKWNKLKLSVNSRMQRITVQYGTYRSSAFVSLNQNDCFKFLFGANEYKQFKTSDSPPMKIKDVRISEHGNLRYYWPLNEYSGDNAKENIGDNTALIRHPLWVKKMHYEWQKLGSFVVNGAASVAFDPKQELVYVVERDSLKTFSIADTKLKSIVYRNKHLSLRGNHSLYEDQNDRLINFYTDQKTVSLFDRKNLAWSRDYDPITPITDYWQFNKFFSPHDSSLYIIGGYGHFIYKNQIQQYHFPTDSWQDVTFKGDRFTPRYLAALGRSGNGAYVLGGYGSSTGKQMLNPRNLYDLVYFDTKKKTIKKIYDLKVTGEDFVFANSLVINESSATYYGLIFPRHRYNSELQLISGSLKKPNYEIVGSKIPFVFHDINSFADLFYSRLSKKFIAVTTFRDSTDRTHVNVYSLNAPPLAYPDSIFKTSGWLWYLISGILIFAAGVIFFMFRRRGRTVQSNRPDQATEAPSFSEVTGKPTKDIQEPAVSECIRNAIFLFGDLQVYDGKGHEITKQFTPLIKELFLVILLYTIRWDRGISSEKLKELLWSDKSAESARNNRSVNIAKLKNILEQLNNCSVSKETGYWRINFENAKTFIDYQHYINIVKDKKNLDKQKIKALADIIKRGSFLPIANYEWMDQFKAEISNDIIDAYLAFARSVEISSDPELLIEVANYIFYFDSVNEEAMVIKCRALVHMGKHSQAKHTFEDFSREYKSLYNDEFAKNFSQVLSSSY